MSLVSTDRFETLVKLSSPTNFQSWSLSISGYLDQHNLSQYVNYTLLEITSKSANPIMTPALPASSSLMEAAITAAEEAQETLCLKADRNPEETQMALRDKTARGTIFRTLSEGVQLRFRRLQSARGLWLSLHLKFGQTSLQLRTVLRDVNSFQFDPSKSVVENSNRMLSLADRAAAAGSPFSSSAIWVAFTNNMPGQLELKASEVADRLGMDDWEVLAEAVSQREIELQALGAYVPSIPCAAVRPAPSSSSTTNQRLHHSSNQRPVNNQPSFTHPVDNRKALFCRYCRKPNHVIEECRKKMAADKRRQEKQPSSHSHQSSESYPTHPASWTGPPPTFASFGAFSTKLVDTGDTAPPSVSISSSPASMSFSSNLPQPGHLCNSSSESPPSQLVHVPALTTAVVSGDPRDFIVDSACGRHMTGKGDLLSNLRKAPETFKVQAAGGHLLAVEAIGDLGVRFSNGYSLVLSDVLLVPKLDLNLLSVPQLLRSGFSLHSRGLQVLLSYGNPPLTISTSVNPIDNLLHVDIPTLEAPRPPIAAAIRNPTKDRSQVGGLSLPNSRAMKPLDVQAISLPQSHSISCRTSEPSSSLSAPPSPSSSLSSDIDKAAESSSSEDGDSDSHSAATLQKLSRRDTIAWHLKLGHPGWRSLILTLRERKLAPFDIRKQCLTCLQARSLRQGFPKSVNYRPSLAGESLQADVILGLDDVPAVSGVFCTLLVTDVMSGLLLFQLLRRGESRSQALLQICNFVRQQSGNPLRRLRFDNELHTAVVQQYAASNGILLEPTSAYSSASNGRAERSNRTVLEKTRILLLDADIPHSLWDFAVRAAVHLVNHTAKKTTNHAPIHFWPSLSRCSDHLHPFGCFVLITTARELRSKLSPSGSPGCLLGFTHDPRQHIVYQSTNNTIIRSRDVQFFDHLRGGYLLHGKTPHIHLSGGNALVGNVWRYSPPTAQQLEGALLPTVYLGPPPPEEPLEEPRAVSTSMSAIPTAAATPVSHRRVNIPRLALPNVQPITSPADSSAFFTARPAVPRTVDPPIADLTATAASPIVEEAQIASVPLNSSASPSSLAEPQEALPLRRSARIAEFVSPPTTVPSTVPTEARLVRRSARIAEKQDKFPALSMTAPSPVSQPTLAPDKLTFTEKEARESGLWPQFEIARQDELHSWYALDVVQRVAVVPPGKRVLPSHFVYAVKKNSLGLIERFKARCVIGGHRQIPGEDFTATFSPTLSHSSLRLFLSIIAARNLVSYQADISTAFLNSTLKEDTYVRIQGEIYKLLRAAYGLCQAPRAWLLDTFIPFLRQLGYVPLASDPTILFHPSCGVLLAVFVDDVLIGALTMVAIEKFLQQLGQRFKHRSSPLKMFIGWRIRHEKDRILIDQQTYAEAIISEFLGDQPPTKTPMTPSTIPHARQPDEEAADKGQYRKLLGKLMYLAVGTRFDIAFAVNTLASFSQDPSTHHHVALLKVLGYVQRTRHHSLVYPVGGSPQLVAFSDADHGNLPDGRSVTGFIVQFAGCTIAWSSKRQSTIAYSNTEAEFIAISATTLELIALQNLSEELLRSRLPPPECRSDSACAIAILKRDRLTTSAKHFRMRCLYVRSLVEDSLLLVSHIPGRLNPADHLTKALPAPALHEALRQCQLISVPA